MLPNVAIIIMISMSKLETSPSMWYGPLSCLVCVVLGVVVSLAR